MLRSYQLSSSSNRGPNESSASPWTLKDRNDNQETNVRTRTVSTRILGLGIILVGVLVLAVGLIMGLEFPKYVYEKNKEAQCVLHVDHDNYRSWQSGSQWKRRVKIYYWILTNRDGFLYNKETPEFIQRGPYIYTETEDKYNVQFAVTEVSFRKHIHYAFDRASTDDECPRCGEYDTLTTLNPWYLKMIFHKGGETQIVWELIPKYLIFTLVNQGLATAGSDSTHILGFYQNISILGNFDEKTMVTSSPLMDVSLGTWFNSNKNAFPSVINHTASDSQSNSTQFSQSTVLAIYNVFTNSTLLYGNIYSEEVHLKDPESSLHAQCENWADYVCSFHRRSYPHEVDLLTCGIVYILHKCHENDYHSSQVSIYLHSTFCPNENVCLNFSSISEDVAVEFRRMLSVFLIQLTSNLRTYFLPSNHYDLVISHNQSDLALGFDMGGNDIVPVYPAKGLLYQDRSTKDDSLWKVYTCLKDRKMKNNMRMKEYRGFHNVPMELFPHQPTKSVSLASYTDFARPCSELHACVDCGRSEDEVRVFVEDLVSPVAFHHKGQSSISGVTVEEYQMVNSTFTNASNIPTATGIQDVTPFTGFLAWVGAPYMDAPHYYTPLASTSEQKSTVQIEPVTGRIWHKDIKLQWNVGISERIAQAWGRSMNEDFLSVPLPIVWHQRIMTISESESDEYQRLVIRLMAASCGGLIAFSTIAIIIAIVGLIICVYPFKPNKVIPVFDEAINHNVSNSRH